MTAVGEEEEDDAVALARVFCGLASADESVRVAAPARLTIAVVDDASNLLGVYEVSDDPFGYAHLAAMLVQRSSGFAEVAVAADSDDHLIASLLAAAGRPLVVTDDDSIDQFAKRFIDDRSVDEMRASPAARRAIGLARALQAGAIAAVNTPAPRELISYKPILAAHVALLGGRVGASTALREVLRELYPAALRAYPDPAHPLALAVLAALPEPGQLTGSSNSEQIAEEIAAKLTSDGVGTEDEVIAAVTALHVAVSESPRRGGVNKSLASTAAETVVFAIGAVRSADAACDSLVKTLSIRFGLSSASPAARRAPRRAAEPAQPAAVAETTSRFGRRSRREPETTGNGPVTPHPLTTPPVAPQPVMPPPLAPRPVMQPPISPAAAAGLPTRTPISPGNRPVSVPPPPPGMTPITPGSRPFTSTPTSHSATQPISSPASPRRSTGLFPLSPLSAGPLSAGPLSAGPLSAGPLSTGALSSGLSASGQISSGLSGLSELSPGSQPVAPADAGQPFQATLSNAAIVNARAERQRANGTSTPRTPPTAAAGSPTDYTLPISTGRASEPGSRANWPLLGADDDLALPTRSISGAPTSSSISAPPADSRYRPDNRLNGTTNGDGRVKPPWQDMPKEPPALRLVEPQNTTGPDRAIPEPPTAPEPPPLRLVDREDRAARAGRTNGVANAMGSRRGTNPSISTTLTALDRSSLPPEPTENDGDLLIFAAARSAWFTGQDEPAAAAMDWANPNDTGWRAAEKAATPAVAAETPAGLPRRVPQANLVPGSPLREQRPLRIVRDAASIAAHTTGYFRGWRRGQEIGGFAMGGRPGREAAGGWDFTRDGQQGDTDYRDSADYRTS